LISGLDVRYTARRVGVFSHHARIGADEWFQLQADLVAILFQLQRDIAFNDINANIRRVDQYTAGCATRNGSALSILISNSLRRNSCQMRRMQAAICLSCSVR
jgi:hypothetical protein